MNDKTILIDEYIDISNKSFMIDDKVERLINSLEDNLEVNFGQKCNLNLTNDYEPVEGDDEQTDEDGKMNGSQLNGNSTNTINITATPTQRRRRKSSGRSKLTKTFQSTNPSICNNLNQNNLDSNNVKNTEDAPQSSSSTSLSSWCHLPKLDSEQNKQSVKNSKNLKNLNSSCDTISEEEHRAKKRNLRSIDDDIVSSNDDLPIDKNFINDGNKLHENGNKLDKKSSCDSLSSSPTNNVSYDSSSPMKSTNSKLINKSINGNQMVLNQNKENYHLFNNLENSNKKSTTSVSNNSNFNNHQRNAQQTHQQCFNCFNNNNYINLEQNLPWFYTNITREDADKFLTKFNAVDGVFLVRTSSKNTENYVLSFVHNKKVQHCHIRKMDVESTIVLSIDDGKTIFYDLKQLVEFYQLNMYYLPTKLKYFLVHK